MKKISLILILALLFSMTACSGMTDDSGNTDCSHLWASATCTEPKTCRSCGETIGAALGHTTNGGVCSRCGENLSSWEVGNYTDEFNQPTGKKYIGVECYGTFSNSATTDSELYAYVQIDTNNIGIMLWDYGSQLVKGVFDYENYNITILSESGTKYYYTGTIYEGGTRIYFKSEDRSEILGLFRNNDSVKIYLKSTKYSVSTYLFEVDTKGFEDVYNELQ